MPENNDDYNLTELLDRNFEYLNTFKKSVNKLGKIVNRIQANIEENILQLQDQEQPNINISNNSSNNSLSTVMSTTTSCINYNLNRNSIDNINKVAQNAVDLLITYNEFMDLDNNSTNSICEDDSIEITTVYDHSNDSSEIILTNNKPDALIYKSNTLQQYGSINKVFTKISALREHFTDDN